MNKHKLAASAFIFMWMGFIGQGVSMQSFDPLWIGCFISAGVFFSLWLKTLK